MDYQVQEVTLPATRGIAIRETHGMPQLREFFTGAFSELGRVICESGAQVAAPPFAQYYAVTPAAVDVEVIMPVAAPVGASGRVHPVEVNGGPAVQVLHSGPYEALADAYGAVDRWLREHRAKPAGPPREVYLNNPSDVSVPSEYRTLVVQPIAPAE
jgi:effector-binding domain-containing protein